MKYIDNTDNTTGLVLFSANWCVPCARLKPHIVEYIDYIFDLSDDNPTDVRGVPTVRWYVNGEVIEELVAPTPAQVKQLFDLTY